MTDQFLLDVLGFYNTVLSAIFIPLATLILGRKLFQERKSTECWNYIRLIIFCSFLSFAILSIIEYFVAESPIATLALENAFYSDAFGGHSFLIGVMVSFGLILLFYINKLESLYYLPVFIYAGMSVIFILTGFYGWLDIYTKIGGLISIVFLYFTAIRVKDNGALGIAVFFSLAFCIVFVEDPLLVRYIIFGYVGFVVFFSLGYFKPFKEVITRND